MRVAVLSDINKLTIQERPKPEIGAQEVLVKVEYCGICGSDVHAYLHAVFFPIGTVMGHEVSGVIAEVGEGVQDTKPGDRVVIKPVAPCRFCEACKNGKDNACHEGFDRDIGEGPERDGAFAEFVRVPWPEEMIFKLPDSLSFQKGALVEPLATALHGVRQSAFKPGDRVVVSGAGPIGLFTIQILRQGGAGEIIVLEISTQRSKIAYDLGADVVLNPIEEGSALEEKVVSVTNGVGADILYECAGVPVALQNSINYVKKGGGQVMAIGITEKDVPINSLSFVLKEIEMKGCIGYTSLEFQMAIDLLEKNNLNTDVMITDIIQLDDIEQKGFKRLIASTDANKILVQPLP